MQRIVYSSGDLAGDEALRKDQWIASLSSGYAHLHADPAAEMSFDGELRIARTSEVSVGSIRGTVKSISRTANDIASENTDNVVLLCNADSSSMCVEQSGRSVELAAGAFVLIEQREPSWIKLADGKCGLIAVQVERARVRQRCVDLEDRFMAAVPQQSSAIDLVRAYVKVLAGQQHPGPLSIMQFAADHIADLITAAVAGAKGEVAELASLRGLRAARLQAVLAKIADNFANPGISAQGVAKELGLSARYVHDLLQETGISFSERVLELRLQRARKMLSQRQNDAMRISEIALMNGFSDMSYFNRCFRRRFGCTPSGAR